MRRDCTCPRAQHQHGTKVAYDSDGCRCEACRAAHRSDRAARRRLIAYGRWDRFTTSLPTALRIQALHSCGWSVAELGRRLNLSSTRVIHLREQHAPRVHRDVATRVANLYDALWNVAPPTSGPYELAAATRIVGMARRNGWPSPLELDDDTLAAMDKNPIQLQDLVHTLSTDVHTRITSRNSRESRALIDDIAVERAMKGDPVTLTWAEATVAVRRLAAMRLSDTQIGQRLGKTNDAVLKIRVRNGIPAGVDRMRVVA